MEIYDKLASLIKGETFKTYIDTGVIYPQIRNNPSTIYSFFPDTKVLNAEGSERTSLALRAFAEHAHILSLFVL